MNKYCFSFLIIFSLFRGAGAQSPLISVLPAVAYRDIPIIFKQMEGDSKEFTVEECEFLFSNEVPLDQKLALMNAMGWGDTTRVETYVQFLMKKYELKHVVFDSILNWRGFQPGAYEPAVKLKADDYSCIAYLQAYGNYFAPLKAYYCAYHGVDMKPASEAAAYIYGLIMAQFYSENDSCGVYMVMQGIKQFDAFTVDRLRNEAINNMFEYINQYKRVCQKREGVEINCYNKPKEPQKIIDKKNYVDLEVLEIKAPELGETSGDNSSYVKVKIKNKGTLSSIETNAKLIDLDISAGEARKRKFPKLWIQAIEENNARAAEKDNTTKPGIDYDKDWEVCVKIPIMQPGEELELEFVIKDYWIFDSNCEVEVILDADENIEEKDEKNNVKDFVAWG